MVRGHAELPPRRTTLLSKRTLLEQLRTIDADPQAQKRVLSMEADFRRRVGKHLEALPKKTAHLARFNTSPFVLLEYSRLQGYTQVSELESAILPAKLFSSMETSAGNMVQAVALPTYGWEDVKSSMHSIESEVDGRRIRDGTVEILTLKSGPRCLNDSTAKSIADSIRTNAETWAADVGCRRLEFTYGALYGTERRSNKKDWHILRSLCEDVQAKQLRDPPAGKWSCAVELGRVEVVAHVRIGTALWQFIGGDLALLEIGCALIRACIDPTNRPAAEGYVIGDLAEILSLPEGLEEFSSVMLQHSQLEWLFLFMWHFCDGFE